MKIISSIQLALLIALSFTSCAQKKSSTVPEEKPDYQISIDAKKDLIVLDSPKPNEVITSPLIITGKARGPWYFEASFPLKLLDADRKEIARGMARAQSDWMTEDFVPFKAELVFPPAQTALHSFVQDTVGPLSTEDPVSAPPRRIPPRFHIWRLRRRQRPGSGSPEPGEARA